MILIICKSTHYLKDGKIVNSEILESEFLGKVIQKCSQGNLFVKIIYVEMVKFSAKNYSLKLFLVNPNCLLFSVIANGFSKT